nr:site-specific integrase [Sphingomicrobium marinum]
MRTVVDWAVAKGYRDNALAMSVIDKALPPQRTKVKHHKALPYDELPNFLATLKDSETIGRLALEFVILTAARSGEVRLATWDEVDFDKRLWTVPAERMKAGREHVVPLSKAAIDVLKRAERYQRGDSNLIFQGQKRGKPLSDMTLTKILRDMGRKITVHGFRSTFRDWVAEQTDYPGEVAEAALAHAVADKTEAAYRRGPIIDKRERLMATWAKHCRSKDYGRK